MDPWDLLLVEPLENIVRAHSPEPDKGRGEGGDEEGWEQDDEGDADGEDDEEEGADEADEESCEEGEDNDGDGHNDEEAEGEAGEGDLGEEKGLGELISSWETWTVRRTFSFSRNRKGLGREESYSKSRFLGSKF